ncbi:hypothetical protein A9Q78_09690 [Methylophaga sp. 41_12_T18]|nr:hypothetical protein A9Q78_09690 [Methylophaga sp. 41_12_T18]
MKLLIADDDATSRMLLEAMTTKWGYECIVAEDGQVGWELMQVDEPPCFLFIDWEMPKMNGIELIKRIRQQPTNNPPYIILLTARNETADIVEGLNSGANDYVVKPFNNAELQARINVGFRFLNLQADLSHVQSRLARERVVVEKIIAKMQATTKFDSTNVRYLNRPVESTSGDVLFSARGPDNTQYTMLGDFTGHGLVAALGGPMASATFYAMALKGLPISEIAVEINRKMFHRLPTGLFLAAIFFEVNADRSKIQVWNCGMEDVLAFREKRLLKKHSSTSLALGILDSLAFEAELIDIQANDRFYAYSDGITETENAQGEHFGQQRLIQAISEMLTVDADIHNLEDAALTFRGTGDQSDDITVLELTC